MATDSLHFLYQSLTERVLGGTVQAGTMKWTNATVVRPHIEMPPTWNVVDVWEPTDTSSLTSVGFTDQKWQSDIALRFIQLNTEQTAEAFPHFAPKLSKGQLKKDDVVHCVGVVGLPGPEELVKVAAKQFAHRPPTKPDATSTTVSDWEDYVSEFETFHQNVLNDIQITINCLPPFTVQHLVGIVDCYNSDPGFGRATYGMGNKDFRAAIAAMGS